MENIPKPKPITTADRDQYFTMSAVVSTRRYYFAPNGTVYDILATIDTMDDMLERGTIDQAQHAAVVTMLHRLEDDINIGHNSLWYCLYHRRAHMTTFEWMERWGIEAVDTFEAEDNVMADQLLRDFSNQTNRGGVGFSEIGEDTNSVLFNLSEIGDYDDSEMVVDNDENFDPLTFFDRDDTN